MKRGAAKTANTEPARRTRARADTSATAALTDPAIAAEAELSFNRRGQPTRTTDGTQPRQQEKSSLLAFMLSDDRLEPDAIERIRQASREVVTPEALGAFAHYTVELARQGHRDGELAFKDMIVACNKAGSQLAAAAQLSQTAPGTGATSITVTFSGTGAVATHPDCQARPEPDPVIGDLIDADG